MNQNLLHTPEGVRDIYGEEYARKLKVEELIHEKLRSFGYQDIQTPTFEFFDVFSKEVGTTASRELYKFFDKEGNTLVLRPDFTPSMARCAAKYFMEEDIPIRFSYSGNTFTNLSSLQGKLNEVTQMGAELIGDGSVEAEAEMIAMLVQCLKNTGLEQFQVSVGQVDYFRGICQAEGLNQETEESLRENISGKNIFAVEDILKGCSISGKQYQAMLKLPELFGTEEILDKAAELVANERSLAAVERLKQLYELLKTYHVEQYISFDFGMLNKYNYYTGVIFRAYTYGVGEAIVKGGRYDNLLGKFGKKAPAIGFVVVIDDMLTALSSQHIQLPTGENNILIIYEKHCFDRALKKAMQLREEGKYVELIPKNQVPTEKYLAFARQHRYSGIFFEYDKEDAKA